MTRDKTLSRRVFVKITRDKMDEPSKVVWEHEIPILEAVFGEGNIEPAPAAGLDEGFSKTASAQLKPFNKTQNDFTPPSESQGIGFVFIGDARAEFARLIEVYGRRHDENVSFAEGVYGRFTEGRFERILGKPQLEDLPEQQLRAMIRDYGYLPHVNYDASDEEKAAAIKASEALSKANKDALLKTAKDVGVTV